MLPMKSELADLYEWKFEQETKKSAWQNDFQIILFF